MADPGPEPAAAAVQQDDDDDFGVPSMEEPFIQKYLDGRDSLIAQEKTQRSDHAFREYMSPMANEASAIISAIRYKEQQTLWNTDYEDNLAKQKFEVHPGMMFNLAKGRIEESKLFQIVKKMPKGALLHCHLEAMGDIDWLSDQIFSVDGISILADAPLSSPESLEKVMFKFKYTSKAAASNTPSIWSQDYVPNTPIDVHTAASSFDNGGKDGFIAWFKSRVTITHEESLQHHQGPNAIWRKFLSCFLILASLQRYEPIFRQFIRLMLKHLNDDGVRWVDIRSVFGVPFTRKGLETPDDDFFHMLQIMQEEINAFKASEDGQGFWGARLIWTVVRNLDTKAVARNMLDCIEMKLEFPELIAGFDFVGQEDPGRCLAELTPEIFWFKKQCMEAGVDIPFYFHAGETLGDGTVTDENLFDAVLLGTRRIGHGFSLYKHPLLVDMVKDKKILIESCPVSNEVLRLTGSIMSHPLPALLARGVHCSLSNDDPSILGQGLSGMTHDFWQALQGWDNLGLPGLASLAENSVRWATFDDCTAKEWNQQVKEGGLGNGIRASRMKEWAKEFEKFCQWVVLEYTEEVDDDAVD